MKHSLFIYVVFGKRIFLLECNNGNCGIIFNCVSFFFLCRSSVEDKDRQKPFAISYLLLVDNVGRVVECGTHVLSVFKVSHVVKGCN